MLVLLQHSEENRRGLIAGGGRDPISKSWQEGWICSNSSRKSLGDFNQVVDMTESI